MYKRAKDNNTSFILSILIMLLRLFQNLMKDAAITKSPQLEEIMIHHFISNERRTINLELHQVTDQYFGNQF